MTSLRDMNARQQQWMAEKPQGGGNNLYLNRDDIVIFFFCSSGEDGPNLILNYRSHGFESVRNGKPATDLRYCPQQGGDDIPCPHCSQGHTKFKERMSVWMYVQNILHAQMPQDKQYPQIQFEGRYYFNEEVNDFRIWNTSAWRDSPWGDIVRLNDIYKGLHNFTARIDTVGEGLTRRFKLIALPNSATFPDELYQRAKQECEPIPNRLRLEIGSAVATNPTVQAAPAQGLGWTPAGQPSNIAPFAPPGQAIPAFSLPGLSSSPRAGEPPPIAQQAAPVQEPDMKMSQSDNTEFVPVDLPLDVEPGAPTDSDSARRPLKSMF